MTAPHTKRPSRARRWRPAALLLAGCARPDGDGATYAAGDLVAGHVVAPAPVAAGAPAAQTMAVYLTLENRGARPDTLVAVAAPHAGVAMLHATAAHGAMQVMQHTPHVVVPAGGRLALVPGERHVMLERLTRAVVAGDRVPLVLTFARAGAMRVEARVVSYDALAEALGGAARGAP